MPTVLIIDDNVELANLLAVVADAHGIQTRLAYSGQDAFVLLEEHLPDAALVDLLLPDMSGHDVVRHLSSRGVPCFAMSGVFRGESLVREAIDVYGAKGFFEKPFVARDLMERLSESLATAGPLAAFAPPEALQELILDHGEGPSDGGVPPLDELVTAAETTGIFAIHPVVSSSGTASSLTVPHCPSPSSPPSGEVTSKDSGFPSLGREHGSVKTVVACLPPVDAGGIHLDRDVDAAEAVVLGTSVETTANQKVCSPPVVQRTKTSDALDEAVSFGPLEMQSDLNAQAVLPFSGRNVWRPIGRSDSGATSIAASCTKTGSLAETSVPRLLTALHLGQQTGEMHIKRREIVKVVGIDGGRPVSAASNLGSERFARFVVREGRLPEARLPFVEDEARRAGMPTSEALVALGLVSEQERQNLIEQQVKHIIWSTFDWKEGEHQFIPRASPRSDLIKVSLSPGPLILEGIRVSFNLVRLRELVPFSQRFFPTADPPYQLQDFGLGDCEALLLAHADGSKTVEDLLVLSDLSERDALALLHGLAQAGILEPRESATRRSRVVLV